MRHTLTRVWQVTRRISSTGVRIVPNTTVAAFPIPSVSNLSIHPAAYKYNIIRCASIQTRINSKMSAPPTSSVAVEHLMDGAKVLVTELVLEVLPVAFPEVGAVDELRSDILGKMSKLAKGAPGPGDLALPCFVFGKKIKGPPMKTAETLATAITKRLTEKPHESIVGVKAAGPYLNFIMSTAFVADVLTHIASGAYLAPRSKVGHAKVMIEYSQPNTHKAFHVGHCRNAALGDCLVRLHEQIGHEVVAANYFGDEGAHVAKCLWFLTEFLKQRPGFNIDTDVKPEQRGEWLGAMYSSAVEALSLDVLTSYPFAGVVAAKVLKIEKHPAADAPANWNVVTLQTDAAGTQATVVCGGKGYNVDDLVAYTPVGAKLAKGVVEPKDMKGVASHGIIMASKELGIEEPAPAAAPAGEKAAKAPKEKAEKPAAKEPKAPKEPKAAKSEEKKDGDAAATPAPKKESKGGKAKDEAARDSPNNNIHIFPAGLTLGVPVAELGRKPAPSAEQLKLDESQGKYYLPLAEGKSVITEHNERKAAAKAMLIAMEHGSSADIMSLWAKTKDWSLKEFKNIYSWFGVRFDVDFYESECSEPSRKIVEEYRGKVFHDSNGALGADLSQYNLGFCMVLKSDGSGLYATKDLALAKRKFDEFKIDTSVYIVDAAQTLHFKQVFKTLELMGYERAANCVHIPYGQVVLPDGKMSSRKGTVIFFSQLRNLLNDDIYKNFLQKYDPDRVEEPAPAAAAPAPVAESPDGSKVWTKVEKNTAKWSRAELEAAQQQIAVASIKYGMLNHDVQKDIVFVLHEWTAKSGNTGPYMMYAYARIQSIIREVKVSPDAKVDFTLLSHDADRIILTLLHELWDVLERAAEQKNPSGLCGYLFELSKAFSSWYEIKECSVNNAATEDLKATRVEFIRCIAKVIQLGLKLLGIQTLERM